MGLQTGLLAYIVFSLGLSLVLYIDSLVDKPSGLFKLHWFTRKPVSHGLDACSWDYEGSWRIGLAKGFPDPLHLNISSDPVLTCANLANRTAVSFVADPFLFIPTNRVERWSITSLMFRSLDGGSSKTQPPWFAFYEMKNLARYIGEIGVAVSYNSGATWRHVGTALSEPFHLSFPFVLYDNVTAQYLMFAETSGAGDGAIRVYGTAPEDFPLGWRLVTRRWPEDPGWAATRRWFQFRAFAKYVDTAPVRFNDRWWIFTTRVGSPRAGQPKYTLLLYTADTLLGEWRVHPENLDGAITRGAPGWRVPFGIDADPQSARSGGRPFILNGTIHRWAQDCSRYYGEALLLMRADMANEVSYIESVVARYEPRRDGMSWSAERLHHADVQQLPNGSWIGLVDGDRYVDGKAHFIAREKWFVELKALLLHIAVLQLALVVVAVALPHVGAFVRKYKHVITQCFFRNLLLNVIRRVKSIARQITSWFLCAGTVHGGSSAGGGTSSLSPVARSCGAVAALVAVAVAVSVGLIAIFPWLIPCPRWAITVPPFPQSPHYVPDVPYVDPAAPYDVSNLVVVTGCSNTFMDRLENLVASVQYWAPKTRVVVYDMGFSSEQLAQILCWSGIELRRFPWERYPSHVRDLRTYAFKGLTFQLALQEISNVILWLDCGLELRGPLTSVAEALARQGHVSVQQSGSPGSQGSPGGVISDKYVRRFFNLSEEEYKRIKDQPYCAGGFQGYVRGSAAHKRILDPLVSCSLNPESCMAPPGHSRGQHCYDQTAGTLLVRHNNFSSCLTRELYATSSTRKTSYDPRSSSHPIVVASRRYRQPKPYRGMLRRKQGCLPNPIDNPWTTVASEHTETTISHASLAKTLITHAGALADFAIQAASCVGLHAAIQVVFWAQVILLLCGLRLPWVSYWRSGGLSSRYGKSGAGAASKAAIASGVAVAPPLMLLMAGSAALVLIGMTVVLVVGKVQ